MAIDPKTLVGTVVGEWRLVRWIGSGDLAAVFEAERDGRLAAVKIAGEDPDRARRFADAEGRAASIEHPVVTRVYETGTAPAGGWAAMELLEGETLDDRLRREGRLTVEEALRAAEAILDGLAAAHARGVVHGSVKPSHVFATIDGAIKLSDFGAAALRRHEADDPRASRLASAFWAPEQARARWDDVDERTDLWAVGATLFALLTGRGPHDDEDSVGRLGLAMAERAPSLATVRPDLPRHLVEIVDRALAYRPRERFQTAAEMRRAVWRAYERSEGAPPSSPLAAPTPLPEPPEPAPAAPRATAPTRRVPRAVLWGAAVLAALAAVVAVASAR